MTRHGYVAPLLASCLFVVLIAVSQDARALDPSIAPTQYVCRHWGRAEGIPDTSVFAITQTRDGYLWAGTEMGLVRFDGERFTLFSSSNTPAFETSMVSSLLATHDGTLLIGTRTGLIAFKQGEFRRLDLPGGPEEATIADLFEDVSGRVWVGSMGDLGFLDGEKCRAFQGPGGQRLRPIPCVRQTPDGTLWFLGGANVHTWKDGRLGMVALPNVAQSIAGRRDGSLWAFPQGGMRLLAGTCQAPKGTRVLEGKTVYRALEDRDGSLWLGMSSGLARVREGRVEVWDPLLGGPRSIISLFEDRRGNLWIGTMGDGLYCFSAPLVKSFGKPEGLDLGYVNSVMESSDGALWISTQTQGLVRWKDGAARHFTEKDGLPCPESGALLEDSKGRLWVGTPAGLARYDGKGRFARVALLGEEPPVVFSLAELGNGDIVAGTTKGVLLLRSGPWENIEPSRGAGFTMDIEPDGKTGAWLATLGRGLLHWDGRRMKTYGPAEGLPSQDLVSLRIGSDGLLWIGTTNRGLACFDGKRFRAISPADGLPEGPIYWILEAEGSFWLSGKAGIVRIPRQNLDGWLAGKASGIQPQVYGGAEGMRVEECNGGSQPSGWKAKDGTLWFPTVDGVAQISPKALTRIAPLLPPNLEEVLVDGVLAPIEGGRVRLSPGARRLEMHYTAPLFPASHGLRFEYCLEGFDSGWVQAGPRRVAYYTSLPCGTYRFRARAAEGGPWSETGGMLTVIQSPRFYQTWWFILLCVATALLAGFGLHRLRVLVIQRRYEAVLEERARISREIHDSLTQSFAGIVLNLEAAEGVLDRHGGFGREFVAKAKTGAREGLQEARRFVKGLRPLYLDSDNLPSALRRIVREARQGKTLRASFSIKGRWRQLPPEVEDHLLRIAQELLSNASRHAQATQVWVALAFAPSAVTLAVQDNGKGFDPSFVVPRADGGFGLRGIRERVEAMKGALEIQAAPGQGTRVAVRVPR